MNRLHRNFLSPVFGLAVLYLTGCIGWNIPQPFSHKPYTLLKGEQLGRDQLANRLLVADLKAPIRGFDKNQILSLLGQPQNIQVLERDLSEDWHFVYYRRYKTFPSTPKGRFVIRFYRGKVRDVAKVTEPVY